MFVTLKGRIKMEIDDIRSDLKKLYSSMEDLINEIEGIQDSLTDLENAHERALIEAQDEGYNNGLVDGIEEEKARHE